MSRRTRRGSRRRRPRFAKTQAATRAARAPCSLPPRPTPGAPRGGMTGSELRLACAQPGDQIAIFREALEELSRRSAHLYRDGDSYWYSPQPTLNKLAADRARGCKREGTPTPGSSRSFVTSSAAALDSRVSTRHRTI